MEKLAGFFSLDRLYNYLGLLCGGLAAALFGLWIGERLCGKGERAE